MHWLTRDMEKKIGWNGGGGDGGDEDEDGNKTRRRRALEELPRERVPRRRRRRGRLRCSGGDISPASLVSMIRRVKRQEQDIQ